MKYKWDRCSHVYLPVFIHIYRTVNITTSTTHQHVFEEPADGCARHWAIFGGALFHASWLNIENIYRATLSKALMENKSNLSPIPWQISSQGISDPIYSHLCVPLSVFSGKDAPESLKLTEMNWTSAGSKSLFIIRVTIAQLWGLGLGARPEWTFNITRPWIHAAGSVAFINKNWFFSALFLTLFGLAPELTRQGRIYPSQNSRYTDFCIIPAGLVAGWQLHNPSVILRL